MIYTHLPKVEPILANSAVSSKSQAPVELGCSVNPERRYLFFGLRVDIIGTQKREKNDKVCLDADV